MNFKLDSTLKEQFEAVAQGIGINSSALLNILIKRTVAENGVPFAVTASPCEAELLSAELEKGRQDYLAGRTHSQDEVRAYFKEEF
jgi:addiction module RelB/DinJ family antitoxin